MAALTRILYVEDAEDIQMVAKVALEIVGGYEVCVCSSGSEALTRAPVFQPDLFLLDVMMPDMDGPTTLAALRQLPGMGAIPAIFMTAKVQSNEVAEYLARGAQGVISKPFDPMKLATEVREIWEAQHA